MREPPIPLVPSGLADTCPDVRGTRLCIRTCEGWGWTRWDGDKRHSAQNPFASMDLLVEPLKYIEFTAPRCGLYGRLLSQPEGYHYTNFLAFIMSDGCDFNFTDAIAPSWRVFVGDGEVDLDSDWMPVLRRGATSFDGYGTVAESPSAIDQWEQRTPKIGFGRSPEPIGC